MRSPLSGVFQLTFTARIPSQKHVCHEITEIRSKLVTAEFQNMIEHARHRLTNSAANVHMKIAKKKIWILMFNMQQYAATPTIVNLPFKQE